MTPKIKDTEPVVATPDLLAEIAGLDEAYKKAAEGFVSFESDPDSIFIGLQLEALHEVQKAMEAEGVSRADLARRLGCSRANVSRLLNDEVNFKLDMLAKLAAALNRDVAIRLIRKTEAVVVAPATIPECAVDLSSLFLNTCQLASPPSYPSYLNQSAEMSGNPNITRIIEIDRVA